MAEEKQGASPEERPRNGINLKLIYLKDASFETPGSPGIFASEWKNPSIKIAMSHHNAQISDDTYEVIQTITLTATLGETTAYLAEVQQAGIFIIAGFNPEQRQQMLNSYCLEILYPYTRETISSLVNKGGFPNIALVPINFRALYEQELKQIKENESAVADAAT